MKIKTTNGIMEVKKGYINHLTIEGYIFPVLVHRPITDEYITNKLWVVSEWNTGLKINHGKTRKDALENAKATIIRQTVKKAIELINSNEVINKINCI